MMNPVHAAPDSKRLARIYPKVIYFGIMLVWIKFSFIEPTFWKFFAAVGHVFAAKDTESKHLPWR